MRVSYAPCLNHVMLQITNYTRSQVSRWQLWPVERRPRDFCGLENAQSLCTFRWFEKSAYVHPTVQKRTRFPLWWGARWRSQYGVHICFINNTDFFNSTEVVFDAMPPCGTSCNQVNFWRNHNDTKRKNQHLVDAFFETQMLLKRREHCKAFLSAHWWTSKWGTWEKTL